ncbi:hypothetical protein HUJ04_000692 [Dendroctonus ponderosae]|uniref:Cohesin subunit SCC3/SA HEAT-repeats domain-containing protein n=1 Tax=Dendroctonus ponderosae TaxID=77166 RepID=A0AAR5NYL8_DENPD|nr:hypothetical protein HUJ04_000692 [Dendroctonus ponderosae]
MASPSKRRKLNISMNVGSPIATSTPQVSLRNVLAERQLSSIFSDNVRNLAVSSPPIPRMFQNPGSSTPEAPESVISSFSNFTIDGDDEEECANYKEFLRKCRKIQRKGFTWNLYEPSSDDEGSLYYQLAYEPIIFSDLACNFVQFCKMDRTAFGIFALFRFYFDCSGFQGFDLEKHFKFKLPLELDYLCQILKNEKLVNSFLKSTKFLFIDKSLLAQVLRYSIVQFLDKFVLEAHKEGILDGDVFRSFLSLLKHICENSTYKSLLVTAYIFAAKILTILCKINVELLKMGVNLQNRQLINKYIRLLYFTCRKICGFGATLSTSTTALTRELWIWVQLCPQVFVGDFECARVLHHLITNQIAIVRLEAIKVCLKMIENEKIRSYLKSDAMQKLTLIVVDRLQDINDEIRFKALDMLALISREAPKFLQTKTVLDNLVEYMHSKDFTVASGAAKCVIFSYKTDSNEVLLMQLSEVSQTFNPKLASALVESCISHTNALQNWSLIVQILLSSEKANNQILYGLSDLLYEAVYITLRGKPTKVRPLSNQDMLGKPSENASIADALYPNLKALVALHATNEYIVANIFKVLAEIDHTYLSQQHYEILYGFVEHAPILFNRWHNTQVLRALLSYLNYINKCFPNCSNCINAITVLKTEYPKRFMDSLNKQSGEMLLIVRKTALLFEAFDLNEHIAWETLISAPNIDNVDSKFVEEIWTICHWSLMWRAKVLTAAQLPVVWQMAMELFSDCINSLKLVNLGLQHKAFEIICETSVGMFTDIRSLSRRTYFKTDMPSLKTSPVIAELMTFFHLNVEPSSSDNVKHFRKYIFLLYNMCSLEIIPMECLSSIFQYFDKYYVFYGELIEVLLIKTSERSKNWLSQLVLYSILLLFGKAHNTYELAIKPKKSTDEISNLVRRFYSVKQIWCPETTGKLLLSAVYYASTTGLYDLLKFVTIFISQLLPPEECNKILKTLKTKVPVKDHNLPSISDFVKVLDKRITLDSAGQQEKASDGKTQAP